MGTAANLSYCLREVRPPYKLRGASPDSFKYLHGNRASSRVEAGISVFSYSCDRHLGFLSSFNKRGRPPLSSPGAWGKSEFLSRRSRGSGPDLQMR